MFVPVACSACGKPFQVPEEAVGTTTACPWCRAAVLALPIAGAAVTPGDSRPPARPEPLPPVRQEPRPEPLPLDDEPVPEPQPASPPTGRRLPVWVTGLSVFLLLVAGTVTSLVLRHKQGHMVGMEWRQFAAPDDSCAVELLARPVEEGEAGEKRYVSEGWYSGTLAWVGWRDLDQQQRQLAEAKDAWQHFAKLFDAERDRLKTRYDGTVTREATTKFEDPLTREVRLATPRGPLVERMIVKLGKRPRVYFLGMVGKNLDPDGPQAKRFFDSFRVPE